MVKINEAYRFAKGPAVELSLMPPFIDRLAEQGFRVPFQEHRPPFLLERWDHPDGRYKMIIYKAGGIYTSEDVIDPRWKEMLGIALRGQAPSIVFTSEAWYRLRINNPTGNVGEFSQLLSPELTPKDRYEWRRFTNIYVPPVPVPVFKGTRMILENGRAGKLMFIRTYRAAPSKWAAYLREATKRYGGMRGL
jgi:hypothetical protein